MNDESTIRTHTEEVTPAGTRSPNGAESEGFPMRNIPETQRPSAPPTDVRTSFLASDECKRLRGRWETLQVGFVDNPGHAVEQARELVAETVREVTKRLTNGEGELRKDLHSASTEEQRVAFQHYRSFFERLLAI